MLKHVRSRPSDGQGVHGIASCSPTRTKSLSFARLLTAHAPGGSHLLPLCPPQGWESCCVVGEVRRERGQAFEARTSKIRRPCRCGVGKAKSTFIGEYCMNGATGSRPLLVAHCPLPNNKFRSVCCELSPHAVGSFSCLPDNWFHLQHQPIRVQRRLLLAEDRGHHSPGLPREGRFL